MVVDHLRFCSPSTMFLGSNVLAANAEWSERPFGIGFKVPMLLGDRRLNSGRSDSHILLKNG